MLHEAEKRSLIGYFGPQYRRARKGKKGAILTEVCERSGWSRKHAARLLRAQPARGRPKIRGIKRGRPGKYQDPEFRSALRKFWKHTNFMCSRHLHAAIPEWLPYIEKHFGEFSQDIRERLRSVSHSTIDRILKPYRGVKGVSHTRSGGFRDEIPIQENIWDVAIPGYVEVDTAAHCGGSMGGEFLNTVMVVDIATTWTEARVVYGRGSQPVLEQIKHIETTLPFELIGYDADNGGEVLNKQLLHYFTVERKAAGRSPVQVTRSREYRKNDNAHVEQRNNSVARRYLGYTRLGYEELLPLVQYYYVGIVTPLMNHFMPTFKLKGKERKKSRTRRVYDVPVTPYQRVMDSKYVPEQKKLRLKEEHERLDPVALSKLEKEYSHKIFKALKALQRGNPASSVLGAPELPPAAFPEHANKVSEIRISAHQYHELRKT